MEIICASCNFFSETKSDSTFRAFSPRKYIAEKIAEAQLQIKKERLNDVDVLQKKVMVRCRFRTFKTNPVSTLDQLSRCDFYGFSNFVLGLDSKVE